MDDYKSSYKNNLIIILVLAVLAFASVIFVIARNKNTTSIVETVTPTVQQAAPTTAVTDRTMMSLAVSTQGKLVSSQPVDLVVSANSQGANIVGYDVVIPIDEQKWTITDIQSLSKSFQVQQYKRTDHISITAFKKLGDRTPTAFANTPVLKITLKAKQPGSYNFALSPIAGPDSTNMIDDKTKIHQPQIQPVSFVLY